MFSLLARDEDKPEVKVGIGKVGFDDGADFVVEFGEPEIAFVEEEVAEVVV